MRVFEEEKFEEQATHFIKEWVRLLSQDRFQEALDLLDIQNKEDYDFEWTTEVLKEIFLDYGWERRMPVINDPFSLTENDVIDFYKYNDGSGYAVEYDLPLDGEISDLTIDFSFEKTSDNLFNVFLHDLHVK